MVADQGRTAAPSAVAGRDAAAPTPAPTTALTPAPTPAARLSAGLGRRALQLCGPAVVVAVAYVDPGNFATNTEAGSRLGAKLLWVVLAASAAALLVQYLAAKLGAVTGRSLAQACRDSYRPGVVRLLWLQAEIVAMATDVAEVLGAALALNLLFGLPLPAGGLLAGALGIGLLLLETPGRRRFEAVVALLLLVVLACFVYQVVQVGAWSGTAPGLLPSGMDGDAALLAAGIVGATVMPHAVHVHSYLAAIGRHDEPVRQALAGHRRDVTVALVAAAAVNAAILIVAAAVLHSSGLSQDVDTLSAAYAGLGAAGAGLAIAFAVALLVAGIASTGVGVLAGDVIMNGFLGRTIPVVVRRLITLAPAMVVLALPGSTSRALVLSQVVLSFGVPFTVLPLIHVTASRRRLGAAANRRPVTLAALVITAAVCGLNVAVIMAMS